MTAKEYLNQYRVARLRIHRYRERIDQISASLEGSGGRSDGMPRSGAISKPTETNAVRLADMRERLERLLIDSEVVRQTIADEIERVGNPVYQELLYSRYVKCLDWSGVTLRVSSLRDRPYDESYVRGRLHSSALQEFSKINLANASECNRMQH